MASRGGVAQAAKEFAVGGLATEDYARRVRLAGSSGSGGAALALVFAAAFGATASLGVRAITASVGLGAAKASLGLGFSTAFVAFSSLMPFFTSLAYSF